MSTDTIPRPTHDVTGNEAADSTAPEPSELSRDEFRQGRRAPGLYRKMVLGTVAAAVVLAITYALVI